LKPTVISDDVVTGIENEIRTLTAQLRSGDAAVDHAMADFVDGFLDRIEARGSRASIQGMVALPLLVHGAETGDPAPAAPAALIHLLWWAFARYVDDVADDGAGRDPAETNRGILSAIAVCYHLTERVMAARAEPRTADRLRAELNRSCLAAVNGQLLDLSADPLTTDLLSVLRSYRGKTGSPYAMAAAMAAILAGCDENRTERWRAFGIEFGLLRQLVNDQRDLASDRNEDLRNGTATYLLVLYLDLLSVTERDKALRLLEDARADSARSAAAVKELAARLLDHETLTSYRASLAPLVQRTRDLLDGMGGRAEYIAGLHGVIDDTLNLVPLFELSRI